MGEQPEHPREPAAELGCGARACQSRPRPNCGRWWPGCRSRGSGRPRSAGRPAGARHSRRPCAPSAWPRVTRPAPASARARRDGCRAARSPITLISGWPGTLRSGSTSTRPARSVWAPVACAICRPSGEAATPAAHDAAAGDAASLALRRPDLQALAVDGRHAANRCGPPPPGVPAGAAPRRLAIPAWPAARAVRPPPAGRAPAPGSMRRNSPRQRVAGDLRQRAGHLHAGGAARRSPRK